MLNDVTPRPNENEQLAGNYRALPVTLCGLSRSVVHPRYCCAFSVTLLRSRRSPSNLVSRSHLNVIEM